MFRRHFLFVALFSVMIGPVLGQQPPIQEAPPNWLSEIIQAARKKHRFREPQTNEIRQGIKMHGGPLAQVPKLNRAINSGLEKAKEVERQIKENPMLKTASPAIQASWTIFDDCGVPRP